MAVPKLSENDLVIERLKEQHAGLVEAFCCGSADEDEFLKKDAFAHQNFCLSETYLLFEKGKRKIISYATLAIGSFKLSPQRDFFGVRIRDKPYELPGSMPCILIGKLATDKEESNRGGGSYLVSFAIKYAIDKSRLLPVPFLALHTYLDKVAYYEKLGFEKAFQPSAEETETICMYMNLAKLKMR